MTRKLCLLAAIAALAWIPGSARLDTWLPPTTRTTESADHRSRVTVVPRPIGGALAFFEDKVKGKEPAGQAKGDAQTSPVARVEKIDAAGKWQLAWQKPLVNDVAPPTVLLADGGAYLVTFDNWHSAGFGDDVVVIYDAHGNLVKKFSLDQILPSAWVHFLPRSVSSRWWGRDHRLVDHDQYVELGVFEPGVEIQENPARIPVRLRLSDGAVMPVRGPEWQAAVAKADKLEAERMAAWETLRQLRASPLKAPATKETRAWRRYMFELRDRISSEDEMMGGMVLAAKGEERGYFDAKSISLWVQALDPREEYGNKSGIFASPESAPLADVLSKALRGRKKKSLEGVHIVFVGSPEDGQRVAAAAQSTGARITLVDSGVAYPAGKPLPAQPPELWLPPYD